VSKLPIPRPLNRWPLAITLVTILVTGAAAAPVANGQVRTSTAATARAERVTDLPLLERQLLAAINAFRHQQGLGPLRASAGLASAAREQSFSMAQHGFFAHESFGGSPFWRRVESKYPRPTAGSWNVGENLVYGSPGLSAGQALQIWLNSPPHRENLMRRSWREIGIAAVHAAGAPGVYGGADVTILTADFGVRH